MTTLRKIGTFFVPSKQHKSPAKTGKASLLSSANRGYPSQPTHFSQKHKPITIHIFNHIQHLAQQLFLNCPFSKLIQMTSGSHATIGKLATTTLEDVATDVAVAKAIPTAAISTITTNRTITASTTIVIRPANEPSELSARLGLLGVNRDRAPIFRSRPN